MDENPVLATAKVLKPVAFDLRPGADARAEIMARLGLTGLRKLSFAGEIAPEGDRDLALTARLGATAVQACVVTGDPVTTRIDTDVTRRYLADLEEPEGDEVEMPEDDTAEPLPASIDLASVMEEALSLALPDFPRADGVDPVDLTVTEPGVAPMTDEDAKPFAGLKGLKDKLSGNGDGD